MSRDSDLDKGSSSLKQGAPRFGRFFARAIPFIVIVIAILLFFNKMVFSNLILARGDTFLYFYPYWNAAADALRSGHLPLWNNLLFMGAPFLANSQVGLLYPLNWPFWLTLSTPNAVTGSIILHLAIAGWGAYLVARRCLSLTKAAAVFSAVLFALGGYLTAQVEHINQLQGLAWLPWYFVAACHWRRSQVNRRSTARFIAVIAILMSLQLLAGHTQTVFISVFGLLIWIVSTSYKDGKWRIRRSLTGVIIILLAALLALLIAGFQVAPTFELLMNSSRQGGFSPKEALSFSLHPLVVTRSLLPQYSDSLFTEYAAFLPLSSLLLAIVGAWSWRRNQQVRAFIVLSAVGFLFALGMFNPIYQLLVRMPGFDLFRVPARWLALYAFGIALLAGAGLETLLSSKNQDNRNRALSTGMLIILALIAWGLLSTYLASVIDVGSEITIESPDRTTWILCVVELALAAFILYFLSRSYRRLSYVLIILIVAVVLFSFTRTLPYNQLTTPEAFSDLRSPSTRLQASAECHPSDAECFFPPGRVLSLSDLFFDPGDQAEIDSVYGSRLSESALYDYTIAIKQKEILAPDLSMLYGIQSVDGFDGGVLPLADYAELMTLILSEDTIAVDGRLREYLDSVPEARWMDLFNARYLITDKVGDAWHDGVFFDRQHPADLGVYQQAIEVGFLPEFLSTELWFISTAGQGAIDVTHAGGVREQLFPERIGEDLYRVQWSMPSVPSSLSFSICDTEQFDPAKCSDQWTIEAATLVDGQEGVFMPIILGEYRLLHSGDVKIYENLDVFPRAFLVNHWREAQDVTSSIDIMADPSFDSEKTAVVIGAASGSTGSESRGIVEILDYKPELVRLTVTSDEGGLLVLTDAYYPGWKAAVGGEQTEIYQTDGYFRGVMIPPGHEVVEFRYEPVSLSIGIAMSAIGVFILLVLLFTALASQNKPPQIASSEEINSTGLSDP